MDWDLLYLCPHHPLGMPRLQRQATAPQVAVGATSPLLLTTCSAQAGLDLAFGTHG